MDLPEHLWRFPTADAIESLVEHFDFADHPDMQDWQWEVADPTRIAEFLAAYTSGELSDDERFTLMETILESCERHPSLLEEQPWWPEVTAGLRHNVVLHAYSIHYWACLEDGGIQIEDAWSVTPHMRQIVVELPDAFR